MSEETVLADLCKMTTVKDIEELPREIAVRTMEPCLITIAFNPVLGQPTQVALSPNIPLSPVGFHAVASILSRLSQDFNDLVMEATTHVGEEGRVAGAVPKPEDGQP